MKTLSLFLLFHMLLQLTLFAQPALTSFTTEADAFLRAHVANGRVDYAGIKKNSGRLSTLYNQISAMNLTDAPAAAKKAFYINAYNLTVIHQVVSLLPLKSPLDAPGFFDKRTHRIAGEQMTLNQLEKEKLLKPYADARIHFAVVCAAKGCPVLASSAYRPQNVEAQLDEQAKLALNSPYFIRVNAGQKQVEVSKIFDWYQSDFTAGGQSVVGYINTFRQEKIPAGFKVGFYEYDWNLNSQ